jgi:hypothetical protein
VNQLSLPETFSLEKHDEYGELESKLYVTRSVSSEYVPVCRTKRGCTEDGNDVGQPMVRLAF